MKRVININNVYGMCDKYVLNMEYNGFGVYEEYTPRGFAVHQSWLVSNNKDAEVVIKSFNHMCKEEVLDMIDRFNKTSLFGIKAKLCNGVLYMNNAGIMV